MFCHPCSVEIPGCYCCRSLSLATISSLAGLLGCVESAPPLDRSGLSSSRTHCVPPHSDCLTESKRSATQSEGRYQPESSNTEPLAPSSRCGECVAD